MSVSRILLVAVLLLTMYGCKHPLAIFGEGDIVSASGTRDCYLEDFQQGLPNCSENEVTGAYSETYTGVPRPGWQFRRWTPYCKKALNNECSFNVGANTVENHADSTFPALKAVFRSTVNTGFTALFMGNELFDPFANGIEFHAHGAGFPDHGTTTFFASGSDGAPQALWDDTANRAAIQAILDGGDIELLGMTYSPAHPSVTGYKKWVNYALQQHPDTRFFITTPWSPDPEAVSATQYEADFEATHAAVHALVDELREAFPGVDFYDVPLGRTAVELYHLYEQSNLPDVSALVGAPANAVFQNDAATPGDILVALGELLWVGAIYDVDISGYDYDPGYITDLKALAQGVIDGHDATYNAPDEVDVDTDGDGIVDRLDPNPTGKPNILLIMPDDMGYDDYRSITATRVSTLRIWTRLPRPVSGSRGITLPLSAPRPGRRF
ncbi:MAG: hypothetical protein U5K56_11475 [Halioglobus sp.]|nr:hypothetical protein [Halioglobus sp.]